MRLLYHDEVEIFIRKLEKPTRSKILRTIELVEKYGPLLGMPHERKITDCLHELRVRGRQEVRILYYVERNLIVLIHGFIKKSQKTPKREIETALRRIEQLT
jgi:phage-related protein